LAEVDAEDSVVLEDQDENENLLALLAVVYERLKHALRSWVA